MIKEKKKKKAQGLKWSRHGRGRKLLLAVMRVIGRRKKKGTQAALLRRFIYFFFSFTTIVDIQNMEIRRRENHILDKMEGNR
jgi:hypothetical protein